MCRLNVLAQRTEYSELILEAYGSDCDVTLKMDAASIISEATIAKPDIILLDADDHNISSTVNTLSSIVTNIPIIAVCSSDCQGRPEDLILARCGIFDVICLKYLDSAKRKIKASLRMSKILKLCNIVCN